MHWPARTASLLLAYSTCSPRYPGHHPKGTFPGRRIKAGWRWRAGPAIVQGFSVGVCHGFQPLLLAGATLFEVGPVWQTKNVLMPPWAMMRLCQAWRPQERPFSTIALASTSGNSDSPTPCCAT